MRKWIRQTAGIAEAIARATVVTTALLAMTSAVASLAPLYRTLP